MRDSFSQFLNDAGKIPLLSHEEEITLARQIQEWMEIRDLDPGEDKVLRRRQKRGERAYNRFFEGNIRMVVTIARKYTNVARELGIDDLTMEGMIGLSRAIELFDPSRGYKFSTYAYNWIRQSITRSISHFDRSIRLPVNGIERMGKLSRWVPQFRQAHGRNPTPQEMAEFAECTLPTLEGYLQHEQRVISLDIPTGETHSRAGDGGVSSLGDLIPDMDESNDAKLERSELREEIDRLLSELPPSQSSVLKDRYGLDGPEQKLVEIAKDWGTHRNVIWERQELATKRLRVSMLPLWRRFAA